MIKIWFITVITRVLDPICSICTDIISSINTSNCVPAGHHQLIETKKTSSKRYMEAGNTYMNMGYTSL